MNNGKTEPLSPAEIRSRLAQCTGTMGYYRHPYGDAMVYTDGVKLFADLCAAYWFIDILMTEPAIRKQAETFAFVALNVDGSKAVITVVEDSGMPPVFEKEISPTDCPQGKWEFYMTDDVILLPSEY